MGKDITIVVVSIALLATVWIFWDYFETWRAKHFDGGQTACTADAMQCSDGTWVGRSGPNCEFVCPEE